VARKWWTLVAVCAGVFMLVVDITIVNVALPSIQRGLHASLPDLQWVIDAYTLTLAALLLTAGSIADLAGRRRVFAVGLAGFTAGSAICGLAGDATVLTVARALQGVGGAIVFATSLALLAEAFEPSERGSAFAIWGAVLGVAAALGPLLGGAIASGLSWRWIFFVNVPIGAAALLVTLTRVGESRAAGHRKLDWGGFVSFSAALAALVFGLIRSSEAGWGSTEVVVSLAAAALLLIAFLAIETRVTAPMLDLGLLQVPTFDGGLIAAWSLNASIYSLFTFIVLYLQNVLTSSVFEVGLRMFAMTGAMLVTSMLAGRLTNRVPIRWLIAPGFALIAAGLALMAGIAPGDSWTHLLPGLIGAGLGVGLVTVPLASTAVGVVEPARAGMASGINSTFRMAGIATGVAALGTIMTSRIESSLAASLGRRGLAGHASQLAHAVVDGQLARALGALPEPARNGVSAAARSAFVDALNEILVIGAGVAFAAAVLTVLLIRQRDFVRSPTPHAARTASSAATA
jgi:EmrB/QacA subfamily drug resistance transporter